MPLRPIVRAIGSPCYRLAKMLARILSPLAGKTTSHISNSTEFVKRVKETPVQGNDRMISFDVVSLFTNVPIDGALETISTLLENDDSYQDHTAIPAADICSLTELCLRSTYFQFQDSFYEQVEGTAMGSPLSPVVANLFMEALENKALDLSLLRAKMWVRYMDDTFVLWPHTDDELDAFHEHLNSLSPSIQVTREEEKEGTLAFLDVEVKREGDSFSTRVYRKVTHTDRYLHYSTHAS